MPAEIPSIDQSLAVVRGYNDAYAAMNYEAVASFLTDDVVHITPFSASGDLQPFLHYEGKPAVLGHVRGVIDRYKRIKLINQVYTVAQDPTVVFLEAQGDMMVVKDSQQYANLYIYKFVLRDGLICHISEYANPVTFAKVNDLPLG